MTVIRPATETDIPRLLPLMRALAVFENYIGLFAVTEDVLLRQGFRQDPPEFHALVAEREQDLVGMLVYFFVPFTATAKPTLYMKELYVTDEVRGQGTGEALLRAAAQIALDRGCGAMRWTVAEWNAGGKRFYERLGAQANPVWTEYGLGGEALAALAAQAAGKPSASPLSVLLQEYP